MARLLDSVREALRPRYELESELGGGGMAVVFRGRRDDGRDIAVKVLRPEIARLVGPDRFQREISILRTLDHPHVVPLLDAGVANDLPYLVMPFIEGPTVRDLIELAPQGLPVEQVVAIARDVAEALDHAHGLGIVHRDVKPENILMGPHGAIVADFGLGRALEIAGGDTFSSSGLVLGTPAYMSPEQAQPAGRVGPPSDIYSLGCVLYEMLAGEPPFTGPTQVVLARHLGEPPAPLLPVRPDVPPELERGVLRALAKRPADRPGTGMAIVAMVPRD